MLLYQHEQGHYLAVAPSLAFAAGAGYRRCYDGRDVPDIICKAFLAESGGSVIREDDIIDLARAAQAQSQRRRPRAGRARPIQYRHEQARADC